MARDRYRGFGATVFALIMALTSLILSSTTAGAAGPSITLDPASGPVGTRVTIHGSGFLPNRSVAVGLEIPPPAIGGSSSCGSDAQGDLVNCTLTLPQDTTGGFRRVDASDGTNLTTAPFTITPTARLAPPTGPVGTSVALLGNGFPGGPVPVTFDGAPVPVTPGCTSSELGFLHVPFARDNTCYFTVPPATAGPHRVTVGSLVLCPCLVTLSFTVIPAISLGATSVLPGRADQVSGSGFAAERPITLSLDARGLPTSGNCTTDARGSFVACSVRAEARPGTHTLTATDGTNTASATWSITLNVPRQ